MIQFHLLVIEDDPDIAGLLQADLEEAGYQVTLAGSVMQGLVMGRERQPDLVLTDLGLPDGHGREVVRRLRMGCTFPIIVLTARDELGDKLELLEVGANDYVVKPFDLRELLARIEVQLRPRAVAARTAGDLELYPEQHRVILKGRELRVTKKEFELLALLMEHPGRVLRHEELIEALALPNESNALKVHMTHLRNKFRDFGSHNVIRTVNGVGYAIRP